jgi:hypothetical protein
MGRTFLPRPPVTCRQHLLLLLLSALPGRAAAQKPALVREILLAIQVEGSGLVRRDWRDGTDPCRWSGVICNGTVVTSLDLRNYYLTALPESIGGLAQLRTLKLAGNRLTALPESIGGLAQLDTLDLRGNYYLAALPESIGGLTQLRTLDLRDNFLLALPESLCTTYSVHLVAHAGFYVPLWEKHSTSSTIIRVACGFLLALALVAGFLRWHQRIGQQMAQPIGLPQCVKSVKAAGITCLAGGVNDRRGDADVGESPDVAVACRYCSISDGAVSPRADAAARLLRVRTGPRELSVSRRIYRGVLVPALDSLAMGLLVGLSVFAFGLFLYGEGDTTLGLALLVSIIPPLFALILTLKAVHFD